MMTVVKFETLEQKLLDAAAALSVGMCWLNTQTDDGLTPNAIEDMYFLLRGVRDKIEWVAQKLPPDGNQDIA